MTNLKPAILASTALVAPLAYLELRYAANVYTHFPFVLFAMLWLVAAAFILSASPVLAAVRAGQGLMTRPLATIGRIGFMLAAAAFWLAVVADQMPCFLGVPNCD